MIFRITILLVCILLQKISNALTIAVFGGSGYVGRRICETLVANGDTIISISRSGRPPLYYCHGDWSDSVTWISHDMDPKEDDNDDKNTSLTLPQDIDAAISCIGNINPQPEYDKSSFFGLRHDDERLHRENGIVNQNVCHVAKSAGAKRYVYLSVSYETAKCLEGPIPGYLNGKRLAESTACEIFGEDNTIVIGPSFIYGGRRFPTLGQLYRSFVDSPVAKAYVNGNQALRNLSVAPLEDLVEQMVFSPPTQVEVVARVACCGALGMVPRDIVGPRKQGFFDTNGNPVLYDNVLFVDGTHEIEKIDKLIGLNLPRLQSPSKTPKGASEPAQEGALIGRLPYLYPLLSSSLMSAVFYKVVTNRVDPSMIP